MLAPESRLMLTDALRSPPGTAVTAAVATTYSLDLVALLLAPMTFALHDDSVRDLERVDPIKLLESVRRHAEHTTVFTQAGRIYVPASYRRILTFTEDCTREVRPPSPGRVFHPKVWVVRFDGPGLVPHHRVLCASRNLTFDRSWDTLLVLDELAGQGGPSLDGAPLARFLRELPALCVRPLPAPRRDQVELLADGVKSARFALPDGFNSGHFLPLGFPWSHPFPGLTCERALVVSPFLDVHTVRRLANDADQALLLSRPESLDRVGQAAVGGAETYVLQRAAEREVGEDLDEAPAPGGSSDVPDGLHAKTWLLENADEVTVVTGSANATRAATGAEGNVELDVVMVGGRAAVGASTMWDGTKESPGLSRLTQPYSPAEEAAGPAPDEGSTWEIDEFHAALAAANPRAKVVPLEDGRFHLVWSVAGVSSPGTSMLRPITLDEDGWGRPLAAEVTWGPLTLKALTPYFAVRTVVGTGAARASAETVITAELVGDPESRRRDALADVLRTRADVLRYLAFLLGDSTFGSWLQGGTGDWTAGDRPGGSYEDVVVFEPLLASLARGGHGLDRVASLYADLRQLDNAPDLVPEGWDELWDAVWQAHLAESGT